MYRNILFMFGHGMIVLWLIGKVEFWSLLVVLSCYMLTSDDMWLSNSCFIIAQESLVFISNGWL